MVVKQKSGTKVREARQKRGREGTTCQLDNDYSKLRRRDATYFRGGIAIKVVFVTSCWYSI
jgi:hypothetical protein